MNDTRLRVLKRRQETLFGCEAGCFARRTLLPAIRLCELAKMFCLENIPPRGLLTVTSENTFVRKFYERNSQWEIYGNN